MFRKHDQQAPRRTTALELAPLEDRRLMTRGLIPATAPVPQATSMGAASSAIVATADARLAAVAGEAKMMSTFDSASTNDWIFSGSDAQFGPSTSYIILGAGNAWPTPALATTTTSDPSTPQGKLDAAIAEQSADLQAIQDRSEVTPRLLATLRQAREKVAAEAGVADATQVKTLLDQIETVRASGTFTEAQQTQLKADYAAALKGAGVSEATISELFAAQEAVRTASGVTAADLQTLADDQAAVQAALDAVMSEDPGDAVAFDLAASTRTTDAESEPSAVAYTTGAPLEATSQAAATSAPVNATISGVASANAAAVGTLPGGISMVEKGTQAASAAVTTSTIRPAGFDASVQLARLARRSATSGSGRLQGVANGVRVMKLRGAQAQAVPAAASRRFPAIRGMQAVSQAVSA